MKKLSNEQIISKINEIIESIRIFVNQDGGDLEFLKFEDGYVHIKILGACIGCAFVEDTYNEGLEEILKDELPDDIKGVIIS